MEKVKHFSLFSGIESFKKAMTNLGIENELVGYSEIDKYASVALAAIHGVSEELNYGDITKIDETKIPDCDLITYGFPCQDISVAGLGKGIIEGETRSGLLYDALRIIKHKKPKYAIAENVKNLVGKKFKDDFNSLLEELDSYGYNNYWKVLNAKDYGIPQNRERVFVVSIRKDVDDGKFEFPKSYDSGLRLKDLLEVEVEDKYYIDNERADNLLKNLTTVQKDNLVLEPNELKLHTNLSGGKWDKIHESARRVYDEEGIAPTIPTCGGGNTEPKVAVRETTKKGYAVVPVGDSINLEQRLEINKQGTSNTITTVQKDNYVLEGVDVHPFSKKLEFRGYKQKEVSPCLLATDYKAPKTILQSNFRIRKLTPKECWRLMGFTDEDYRKARQALEDRFYNGKDRSNSQMYKMAGNSIVVDVLECILESIFKEFIIKEFAFYGIKGGKSKCN